VTRPDPTAHDRPRPSPLPAAEIGRRFAPVVALGARAAVVSTALLLAFATPARSAPAAGRLDPRLALALGESPPDTSLPVLVTFLHLPVLSPASRPAQLRALHALGDARLRALAPLLRAHPPERLRPLWAADALALSASPPLIRALAEHPDVASVALDLRWRRGPRPTPRAAPAPPPAIGWNLVALRAPALWALGADGRGVTVAVLDTGADLGHPDLAGSFRGGPGDWFDPIAGSPAPIDTDGHGTQVLGLIVAGAASGAPLGVAPGATWIAARLYDDDGTTSLSAIHEALQWLLDPDDDPATDDAPDVVTNAWGFEDTPDACVDAFAADLAALRDADIAVIFAAGNAGPDEATSVSPANSPDVLSVGALDADRALLGASSRGPSACDGAVFPTLTAPGVDVLTTDLSHGGAVPNAYAYVTGTSFAAPHVAGAVALLLSATPGRSPREAARSLVDAARDLGPEGPDDAFGYGAVDVAAACPETAELPEGEPAATDDHDTYESTGDPDAAESDTASPSPADDIDAAPAPRPLPAGGCAGAPAAGPLAMALAGIAWAVTTRRRRQRQRSR